MNIKELSINEFDSVFSLLQESDLQYSDLNKPGIRLFRFEENNQFVGLGGLEIFGNLALLRSVAVRKDLQNNGLGTQIVGYIENVAKESGISTLFLLTTTSSDFFKTKGYQSINRDDFAEPLKQTAQFTNLCPASAICMKKEL